MRQSRTTLKELTAMYRAVLRYGILCNAIALGLIGGPVYAETIFEPTTYENPYVAENQTNTVSGGVINVITGPLVFNSTASFTGNSSDTYGGAIMVDHVGSNNSITFNGDATFVGNHSGSGGGAIFSQGDLTFNSTAYFADNYASSVGALALSDATKTAVFKGAATFTNNGKNGLTVVASEAGALSNTGTMTFEDAATFSGNAATTTGAAIKNSGTLTFQKGLSVTDSRGEGALGSVANNGDLYVYGGDITFNGNQVSEGGGIRANTGLVLLGAYKSGEDVVEARVDKISFKNNTTGSSAGALKLNDKNATVEMYADKIEFDNNTSNSNYGGAIFNAGDLTIFGNENKFSNNTSNATFSDTSDLKYWKYGGGAIHNRGNANTATLVLGTADSQNVFEDNESKQHGGAIFAKAIDGTGQDSVVIINGETTFEGNKATYNGGAIANYINGTGGVATFTLDKSTFVDNEAALNGGAIYNNSVMNFNDEAEFYGNQASDKGGAIYNEGTLTIVGGTFEDNVAEGTYTPNAGNTAATYSNGAGGAIYNSGTLTVGGRFTNNTGFSGGAIRNTGILTVGDGSTFEENFAEVAGGAIYNSGTLTVGNNVTFKENDSHILHSLDVASGGSEMGGAIYSEGTSASTKVINIGNGVKFQDNDSYGGTLYLFGANNVTIGNDVEFSGNTGDAAVSIRTSNNGSNGTTTMTIGDNARFVENEARGGTAGAAITLGNSGDNVTIGKNAVMSDNTGSAIWNSASTITFGANSKFENNIANLAGTWGGRGAVLKNMGPATTTFDGATFKNNSASDIGGALYNYDGATINLNAHSGDVVFSGNAANGVANDIFNRGILNLNADADRKISLGGGIDGYTDGSTKGLVNIIGAGTVETSTIKNQTVAVNNGELHLDNADLTGSTVTVASGATLNSIDDVANDYSSFISLTDGAKFALDADFNDGGAFDKYTIADGANVAITQLNLLRELSDGGVAARSFQIAQNEKGNIDVSAVADSVQAFTSTATFGLVGNTANDGTIALAQTATDGGLSLAADATAIKEVVYYNVTADDSSVTTDKLVANELSVIGSGVTDGDAGVTLAATLAVDDDATLNITDTKVADAGSGVIDNREGGLLTIMNSKIGVRINNAGTMDSDPTYYGAEVWNSGTASFTGDVFESGSSLTNSAIVNLNNVTFESGSTLTGLAGNVLNVSGTTNQFNGTTTGNNVVLANGANFTGTLADGSVDARNGGIDTINGSVSGGDLYVDANLVAGTTDAFASTTGATIQGIKLANAGYGTDNSVTIDFGGATLGANAEIEGTNYYTKVEQSGSSITFSDKLVNESSLDEKLGSWTGGTYIKSNTDMNTAADANHLTVGSALSALDTQVKTNADNMTVAADGNYITAGANVAANLGALDTQLKTVSTAGTVASGQTGFTTGDSVYTAIEGAKANTALTGNTTAENLAVSGTMTVGGNAVLTTASALDGSKLTAGSVAKTALDSTVQASLNKADTALQSGDNISALTNDAGYQTASDVSTAISNATIAQSQVTGLTDALNNKANASDLTAVDNRVTAIEGAGYQTAAQVNTAISNATIAQSQVTGLTDALNNKANASAVTAVSDAVDDIVDGTTTVAKAAADENGNNIAATYATQSALTLLGGSVTDNANAIATLNGSASTAGSVANAVATANAYTDSQLSLMRDSSVSMANAYTDRRIEDLDKNMSAGVAGAVALSSVAVSGVERGEVSVGAGYGYFNGQSAAAFGATMGLSNRWSVNAGAGISNADVSFRAGTNYKFKLF